MAKNQINDTGTYTNQKITENAPSSQIYVYQIAQLEKAIAFIRIGLSCYEGVTTIRRFADNMKRFVIFRMDFFHMKSDFH